MSCVPRSCSARRAALGLQLGGRHSRSGVVESQGESEGLIGEAATAPELHLRADKMTQCQALAEIMSEACSAGLYKIGFVPEPRDYLLSGRSIKPHLQMADIERQAMAQTV
jgi:hypothetical protein